MNQIFDIISKKIPMKIILFFIENSPGEFYNSQIKEKIGISKTTSLKWLKKLEENGILNKDTRGKTIVYKLNMSNPIVKQLKILKNVSDLLPFFKRVKSNVFLYGSYSRGENQKDSDIDLLIIGKRDPSLLNIIGKIERRLKRKVNPVFYTDIEWSIVSRKDPAFYERVEKDKIKLVE